MDTSQLAFDDRPSLRAALVFTVFVLLGCGLLYELAGTALGRVLFPHQAQGTLIERDGRVVGSTLVAQPFADARYFQPRPSAAGYDPMAVAGSNQARSNPALRRSMAERRAIVAQREGLPESAVPGDLLTASGSGIDPDLSPAAAAVQVARVAKARGMSVDAVQALLGANTTPPQFGLLGEPRVNVLELNLALDAAARPE